MSASFRQTRNILPMFRIPFKWRRSDCLYKLFSQNLLASRWGCCSISRRNQRSILRDIFDLKVSSVLRYSTSTSEYPPEAKVARSKTLLTNKAFREGIAKFATQLNVNIPGERNLLAAFTHESFLLQNADKITDFFGFNEKLAFLGAQTARKSFTEYLFENFPQISAAEIWDLHNALLEDFVIQKAIEWDITQYALYYRQSKELMQRQTVLALVGAVYVHESPKNADAFVKTHLIPELTKEKIEEMLKLQHPKFILQKISVEKEHFPLKTKLGFQDEVKSRYCVNNPFIYCVLVTRGENNEMLGKAISHSLVSAEKKACQRALLDHYPDEFNEFQLTLDGDEFLKEENVDLGLNVAEQRVVELEKENGSFGFHIRGGEIKKKQTDKFLEFHYMSPVFISHIVQGSVADKHGGLKVGDNILAINDRSVEGLDHERVVKLLKSVSGPVSFTITHCKETLLADKLEQRFKEIKRKKRLAELSSDVWSQWHQAQSNQTPSRYKDVLKYHKGSSS